MSTTRYCIESLMDEMELKYFCREDEFGTNWVLFFGYDIGVMIRLTEDGEFLLFRSLPLINLKRLPDQYQNNLVKQLLKRNDSLKLGHYSADESVVFETSVPIEDGELTSNQLKCCLAVITAEIGVFHKQMPAMCHSQDQAGESIDQLMQRLIDGDASSGE